MMFFCLFFSLNIFAKTGPELVQRIDKLIAPQIGTKANSVVIGVTKENETHFLTYGKAKSDSIYEIASITKTFTSLLFSLAIDKKLVTTETTLAELRPEWKGQRAGEIRLIELATHRSGLTRLPCDLKVFNRADPYAHYTEKQLIESITDKVLKKTPECSLGPRPSDEVVYSNWGAALLGNALSAKTGLSYGELLAEWITKPLGLVDTVVELSKEQKKRFIQGHDSELKPTGIWHRLGMMGNGAIFSTPADLIKYSKAFLHPEATPFPEALKRVQTLQHRNIAYNWFVTRGGNLWHSGKNGGHSSLIKLYPKMNLAVFSLSDSAVDLNCLIEAVDQVPCVP